MSDTQLQKYIFPNSPFIPSRIQEIERRISEKRNSNEPLYFTLAMELRGIPLIYSHKLLTQLPQLQRTYGTSKHDLMMYDLGFSAPLSMISLGYFAIFSGTFQVLKEIGVSSHEGTEQLNKFMRRDLFYYKQWIERDPSGRPIFVHQENSPYFSDIYYSVGVAAAECSYILYGELFGLRFD
jgi:hypothetical protein